MVTSRREFFHKDYLEDARPVQMLLCTLRPR